MRIARLLMVLLALSVTALSAATQSLPSRTPRVQRGGIEFQNNQNKADGGYWYCYATPEIVNECSNYWECMALCEGDCGGPCDDEGGWQ
ncbi:MAG TPA: hypothetical protein VEL74_12825 [Thermoanaerobaculia bacterium]|nr:hypothetical protein [Thermoanaerobaculia bacterium]